MDRRTFLAAAASTALAPAAHAQVYATVLSRQDREMVAKAAAYLQELTTAKGRFTQTSSRGGSSAGTVYLSRPGKARFEYDAPAQMLVVADGRNVSVYDRRLKSFDRYPLGATPLGIFLSRRIRLDEEVMVTRVVRNEGGYNLTLKDARGNAEGLLVLDFAEAPMALRGWTVVDPQGVQTRVSLIGLTPGGTFDPNLFVLREPARQAANR